MSTPYRREEVEDLFLMLMDGPVSRMPKGPPGAWLSAIEIDRLALTLEALYAKLSHYERIAR